MYAGGGSTRRGFTLVELLVTISVIVVLVALFGGAISAARNGAQGNTTTNAIARLDQIVTTQFRRYESLSVSRATLDAVRQSLGSSGTNAAAARAWHIRRNFITGEMPDRWSDVAYMAANAAAFTSPAEVSYIATYNAASPKPTERFGGAECLFMIVMQGGFADCLDCNGLAQLKKGDKDGDGALEFWDDWNNPIDYILWAPGFLRTGDTTRFFSQLDQAFPTTGAVRPGLGMQPLIYSAGPDGKYGLARDPAAVTADQATANTANLDRGSSPAGRDCGNPTDTGTAAMGGPATGTGDGDRGDNITNVERKGAS